jgi:hypothetical protein
MNSTPAKVFLDQTGFHEEQNISLAVLLFKIVLYLKPSYISIAFVMALSSYVVRVQKLTPPLSNLCSKG